MKRICICGGGSLGTVCATLFSNKGYEVNLLTGNPLVWNKKIELTDPNGYKIKGNLTKISSDPKMVIPDSDMVLLCIPGFLIEETLIKIKPYLTNKTIIGSIVASTGFFFQAHKYLDKTQPLFGLQRVPYIARVNQYGKSAFLLGYKDELKAAIENGGTLLDGSLLEKIFSTPVTLLNSYLEVSLSNSNPILHTGRLYSLWHNYQGEKYESPILFYYEWDDEASEYVLEMDKEFMNLIDSLNLTNGSIKSLKDHYEINNPTELTKKIHSINAFKNIVSPMKLTPEGWIPDFESRYFTEDFPYGLSYIKEMAKEKSIDIPIITKVYNWGISKIKY